MLLYTINKSYPRQLPHRIFLSDGRTRTDNTTFTDAEIADAGYTAVANIPSTDNTQKLGWDGSNGVVQTIVVHADEVRKTAKRKILEYCPEWKQRNITNRSMELVKKGSDNWTAEELAEYNANQTMWAKIKEIRDTSNTLEAMSPIPIDFGKDNRWPTT